MGFINYNGIIFIQIRVVLGFSQQDAVSHYFNKCVGAGFIFESDFVTHGSAQLFP